MSLPVELRHRLVEARHIAVLTGAGMSAESGVPTFRDVQDGLWAKYDPMTLATEEAFAEEPSLVWAWYLRRAQMIRLVEPNAGHLALAELATFKKVSVITQNVDDLHERAGSDVLSHVHGGLFDYRCFDCAAPWQAELEIPGDIPERVEPPKCTACGGWIRPGIVWFGEVLPQKAFQDAVDASASCDLMLVVGTSGIVQPAGSLPFAALERGTPVIEINPEESRLTDYMTHWWQGTAAEVLPELVRLARGQVG
ncbi:SIR2 family NAD-dependent protein deacylase [Granulicoccus sp. GXG6511]|uniref:SIR2 family NAD-dependent protein deacylase n=1 Tax=Granulicoccus sp. GXG6511 TaxID=3381351 RepID=UPI003D7E3D27